VGYDVKINGIVIKTLSSLEPHIDQFNNRIPGNPITYDIVGFDDNGTEISFSNSVTLS
jgi:hypothetical protein